MTIVIGDLMNNFKKYRKSLILKVIIIPIIVTAVFAALLVTAAPTLERAVPSGVTQAVQEEAL